MNTARLCSMLDADQLDSATHQRISEFLRPRLEQYRGLGFMPRQEWIGEQTVEALKDMTRNDNIAYMIADQLHWDIEAVRVVVMAFLDFASTEVKGEK